MRARACVFSPCYTAEQRKLEKKQKRKEKRSGKLPSRCVAIVNEKMHKAGDLPLVKGDVIDILDQKDGRYKGSTMHERVFVVGFVVVFVLGLTVAFGFVCVSGKCHGRVGWFDAKCVLIVLDEDMMKTLEQNSDVKYEFDLAKSHVAQATDDFLIMNSVSLLHPSPPSLRCDHPGAHSAAFQLCSIFRGLGLFCSRCWLCWCWCVYVCFYCCCFC